MKSINTKKKNMNTAILILIGISFLFYASATGITGLTLKTSTAGCDCHSASPSSAVTVTISGPDQLEEGETGDYTVTISGGPASGGGTNIAASTGDLTPGAGLKKVGAELTHTSPKTAVSGVTTFAFQYTAPQTAGSQTLYANGNSVNLNGQNTGDAWNYAANKTVNVIPPTNVDDNGVINSFALEQNYPNPFNPSTNINFTLAEAGKVSLKIYNSVGNEVETLIDNFKNTGSYTVTFNASGLASGVYYYKLVSANFSETKKMLLLK